ncbi:efflux RND transporter periplasmic adaptor subunit [Pseudomarimonas arenosa]|uniref:Efflux RND transporter periplasmic adaptor subunit n=1 Tax=Pseudomarimonas arenosa TaxID=2774145 RepID=A0AAW3ZGM1_9GAMM|nr:efflux RND transporter periplasmic adaptor subunit [Pseudomarimonas arenosa]MBD8524162.1 efflux RND transporter periplasmic adaptor subunit [Pseudomarimonas arenosa]
MTHKGRWLIAIVVVALIVLAAWPQSRPVDSAQVQIGTVRATVEAEARTRLRDRYLISSPVHGLAQRLQYEPGAVVHAGQVVLSIAPSPSSALDPRSRAEAEARLAAAQAERQSAEASATAADSAARQAQSDARRAQRLAERGLQAAAPTEQALRLAELRRAEAASARYAVAAADEQVRLAEAALGSFSAEGSEPIELRSPIDGVLLRRHYESEMAVAPGTPLIEVGDPTSLEVEVDVLSADAVRLRESMPVELLRWGEPQSLSGQVRRIEPAAFTKISALGVEEQRVWVRVSLDDPIERWQRLGDAYRLTARFLLDQAQDAVRVPASALFRAETGWQAFRIKGGRARLTEVEVGLIGEGWAEIRTGLSVGEPVILHPERELSDGERVD